MLKFGVVGLSPDADDLMSRFRASRAVLKAFHRDGDTRERCPDHWTFDEFSLDSRRQIQ
jgi:hypothetical protein